MSTRNRTLQQTLRSLHLWLGMIGGILIVMMGLTGVIAVFRPVIENAMAPRVPSRGSFSSLAPVELAFAGEFDPSTKLLRSLFPPTEEA